MPVVVISGLPGAGSSTIARILAKRLGLRYFSVGDYVKSLGPEGRLTSESAVAFMTSERGRSAEEHKQIDELQKKEARKGNVVIDAKLGIYFLRDAAHFKVWVKCSEDARAARVAKRDGISKEEALLVLKEKEAIEQENFKKIYGIDICDQEIDADISVDTSRKRSEDIAEEIIGGMKRMGIVE